MHVDARGTSNGAYFAPRICPLIQMRVTPYYCTSWALPIRVRLMGWGAVIRPTSKVAVVKPSDRADADVDYLFLQVCGSGDCQ